MRRLLRAFMGMIEPPRPRVYELGNAAAASLWLIQARRIGESMDRLARGLR